MDDKNGYAVFFFPQALESLGDGLKPFLRDGPVGEHLVCRAIDTGGAMFKLDMEGRTTAGDPVALEVMIPGSMVRMIVSARIEEAFGFGPRFAVSSMAPSLLADAVTAESVPVPVPAPAASPAVPPAPQTAPATAPESRRSAEVASVQVATPSIK